MEFGIEQLERAIDFCDRALAQLNVLDQPLGQNAVHEVIPLVEAARTELIAVLNSDGAQAAREAAPNSPLAT